MTLVGDKGREDLPIFQWKTVQFGTGENRQDVNEKDVKSCQKIQKQTRYLQYVHTTYAPNTMCLVVNKLGTGDSLTCEV